MEERKIAWISWEKCCSAKEKRGLGLKNIETFNTALIGKWLWRALIEKDSLWVKVLEAKYGSADQWLSPENNVKGSPWWMDLRKICLLSLDPVADY